MIRIPQLVIVSTNHKKVLFSRNLFLTQNILRINSFHNKTSHVSFFHFFFLPNYSVSDLSLVLMKTIIRKLSPLEHRLSIPNTITFQSNRNIDVNKLRVKLFHNKVSIFVSPFFLVQNILRSKFSLFIPQIFCVWCKSCFVVTVITKLYTLKHWPVTLPDPTKVKSK